MPNSAVVYISIGSNIDRERHIQAALNNLSERYGKLEVSSVYESEAVGFEGDNFFNLIVAVRTVESVATLTRFLKQLEDEHGCQRDVTGPGDRTLDLDILTYDDCEGSFDGITLPRPDILTNAFVLLPLAEIAPETLHPQMRETYAMLWQHYHRDQKLWAVSFSWRGEVISPREPVAKGAGLSPL